MSGEIIILGCANGAGVPGIGNFWYKCDPNEPKNRRTRASILVKSANTSILIDTGPDLREQFNKINQKDVDFVLYTHAHADHVHGIDELRTFYRLNKHIYPAYGSKSTMDEITTRFSYMFEETGGGFYPPVMKSHILPTHTPQTLGDITFTAFEQDHGTCTSLGFRFGNVGYSTDMKSLDDKAFAALAGIDTWIVDAAAYHQDENSVHASLNSVYRFNEIVKAPRVILTHLPPSMDYKTVMGETPDNYEVAYDGLTVAFA